ncbi:MAG: class I SAM-dependent methyltransferase [Acidocella sp.]|nr:class I SAM-dependent methyltransferase [Acidocella sp.]
MSNFISRLKNKLHPIPPFPAAYIWRPDHKGEEYTTVLARLHTILAPATYFEIGSRSGGSLALASCASIAIDPQFSLIPAFHNNKPVCHLYAMTSDDFFAAHSPTAIFGRPIDFAFLDGLHLAEFLLRDFINTEPHCKPDSVIALHDCFPTDEVMARRDEDDRSRPDKPGQAEWWTGDVWLAAEALKKYRPDLTIIALDAPPTGLVLVTGLNPASTVLKDKYDEIIASFDTSPNPRDRFRAFDASLPMTATSSLVTAEDLNRLR